MTYEIKLRWRVSRQAQEAELSSWQLAIGRVVRLIWI